jgi:UDP-GlcNAc:undecaprenyl-phosphate/decaprenyl-phosphate GlcNAc-1-phosphate transferase
MHWEHLYFTIFMASGIITLMLTPFFLKIAEKTDFMDRPKKEEHKKHGRAVPLLGGAAMCSAWLLTLGLGIILFVSHSAESVSPELDKYAANIINIRGRLFFICLGAVLITLLGLFDDRFGMSPKVKLMGQIIVSIIAVTLGGAHISVFISLPIISWALSVFWFLVIINAINFFDNMDGLAVGTSAIAMALFGVVAAINQQYFVAALGMLSAGVAVGFWFYNHDPASIFMGDSGSHFLGYMLAVLSCSVTYFTQESASTPLPVLIPMFILAIPLFDSCAVVAIRLKNKKPIYVGDHNHISHRFVKMGMSRKRAVQLVHLLTLIIGLSVLPLLWGEVRTTLIVIAQALLLLLLVSLIHYSVKADHSTDESVKN